MLNKVQLIGRLGGQPEVATTQGGVTITKFTLATSESFRDKQTGERREETEWHRIVMFGKLAEIANQYLGKGDLVFVEGKIKTQVWEKDGAKRYNTEVVCNEMKMLGGKSESSGQQGGGSQQQPRQSQQQRPPQQQRQPVAAQVPPQGFDSDEDDIPF